MQHWKWTDLILIVCMACATAIAPLSAEPEFIGVDKCKLCHKVEYNSWKEMKHAAAFSLLKPEEQTDPACLKCHATGSSAELPGVQCEACHGPGAGYKSIKVMKDREQALAAGLVIPDEATCKSCHTEAPHETQPFDYETAKQTGLHDTKKAAEGE